MTEYGVAPPRFRLPADTVVGAVRLQVRHLPRSLDYYQETLGFEVAARTGGGAVLSPSGSDRPLVRLVEREDALPVPRQGRFGLYHFAILLPDRAALGRFARHLSHVGAYAGTADHTVSESFYLSDPDGLGIEVYADRPRAAWKARGRELIMTVDPLDVRSLIAASGGQLWKGLPAGSRVGHIHLHVGDLARAEAFYHAALGFDKIAWHFPGALFMSAGGYHHHLGTNTWSPGPAAQENEARLLDWELVAPRSAEDAAASLTAAGYPVERADDAVVVRDPWGTPVRIVS